MRWLIPLKHTLLLLTEMFYLREAKVHTLPELVTLFYFRSAWGLLILPLLTGWLSLPVSKFHSQIPGILRLRKDF